MLEIKIKKEPSPDEPSKSVRDILDILKGHSYMYAKHVLEYAMNELATRCYIVDESNQATD